MMHGCKSCTKKGGYVFLVLGLLFLLVDVGVWSFFGVQWWTIVFLMMGLQAFNNCPDCAARCAPIAKGKKKR